jgi:hypothetical protein
MDRPNLFDQGTSELTQDAVLCWLLAWADAAYKGVDPALHAAGRALVAAMVASAGVAAPSGEYSVKVVRQEGHVDVTARIGDSLLIGIEDKTESGIHGGQLGRYIEHLRSAARRERRDLVPIYLKTGEVHERGAAEREGWRVLDRASLGPVLDAAIASGCDNGVLLEYRMWLAAREDAASAWRTVRVGAAWGPLAWQGLYAALDERLSWAPGRGWGYVSNPRGGFHGMWWGWYPVAEGELYLQLQERELAVRLKARTSARRLMVARNWSARILEARRTEWDLVRPGKLRVGEHMAVALSRTWRVSGADGLLDLDATTARLLDLDTWLRGIACCSDPSGGEGEIP